MSLEVKYLGIEAEMKHFADCALFCLTKMMINSVFLHAKMRFAEIVFMALLKQELRIMKM